MDDLPVWTRDDIVRFTHDRREDVRCWAWGWLRRHHPEEAGRGAARGLLDPFLPVVLEAFAAFEVCPTPEAEGAIAALRARDDLEPGIRMVVERRSGLHDREGPRSDREIEAERFARAHDEVRQRAPAMLRSGDERDRYRALSALGDQQHRWATDIILEHFPVLLTSHDDAPVWNALGSLCDPRAMPAIHAAWAPGECIAAKIHARTHYLAGFSTPLPEGIARDAEEAERHDELRNAFYRAHGRVFYPGTRRIAVRCLACRRTGEYTCEPRSMVDLAMGDARSKRRRRARASFACKFCDTMNAYELPMRSLNTVLRGTMAKEGKGEKRG